MSPEKFDKIRRNARVVFKAIWYACAIAFFLHLCVALWEQNYGSATVSLLIIIIYIMLDPKEKKHDTGKAADNRSGSRPSNSPWS